MELLSPKAAQTREHILNVARACFAEAGLNGTSTRTIASRAGVTQPLLNHYFGSKAGLFDAVIAAAVADYDRAQAEQWALPFGDLRFLTRGLRVMFDWLGQNRQSMRIVGWARLEGRLTISAEALEMSARVRKRLEAAQRAGIVRAEIDLDMAMMLMDVIFKGYWTRQQDMALYLHDVAGLNERYFRAAMDLMARGLLTPQAACEANALLSEDAQTQTDDAQTQTVPKVSALLQQDT